MKGYMDMISFVIGEVADFTETSVVLYGASGIGFEIFMTNQALAQLHMGQQVKVYTYFHVKEDGMQLYGFFSKDDLQIFKLLLGVNGVGPKGALGILSGLTGDELRFAVLSDDVKTICKAPGIGKKTAQKLILELKDKLSLEDAFEKKISSSETQGNVQSAEHDASGEAVEALIALGYGSSDALRAVRAVPGGKTMDVEQLLRAALKNL